MPTQPTQNTIFLNINFSEFGDANNLMVCRIRLLATQFLVLKTHYVLQLLYLN